MGVGSNNSHWSQTDDMHFEDHEFEVDEDGEGILDAPKQRAGNYTNADDILLCNTWLQVSRDPSVGGDQSRDAYWLRMKEHFDLRNMSGIDRLIDLFAPGDRQSTRIVNNGRPHKRRLTS